MSAHVLLNKFNNTRACMLNSIYHITFKITLKSYFCRKNVNILSLCMQCCYGHQNVSRKSLNHKWFMNFPFVI